MPRNVDPAPPAPASPDTSTSEPRPARSDPSRGGAPPGPDGRDAAHGDIEALASAAAAGLSVRHVARLAALDPSQIPLLLSPQVEARLGPRGLERLREALSRSCRRRSRTDEAA